MIHLVTDSSADIPRELLQQYRIHVVPLSIRVNGKDYTEGVDITPDEFYREMSVSPELPQTSQPAPSRFARVFNDLGGKGKVLCLTISSKLSGTYASANLGIELSGNQQVTVFDTLGASIGHGLQVIRAAEWIQAGLSLETILGHLHKMREEMKFLIVLDTLENIVKGGRLSRFQGTLAKYLNIKVILQNVEGATAILEKVRGRNRSLQRTIELVGERCSDFSNRIIGITHVDNIADAQRLAAELEKRYNPRLIVINEMGATVASYAGKSGLIVAF